MTREEKYDAVNRCKSLGELAEVILSFADEQGFIQGRTNKFNAKEMADACLRLPNVPYSLLTREFGIRQQSIYLTFYG